MQTEVLHQSKRLRTEAAMPISPVEVTNLDNILTYKMLWLSDIQRLVPVKYNLSPQLEKQMLEALRICYSSRKFIMQTVPSQQRYINLENRYNY